MRSGSVLLAALVRMSSVSPTHALPVAHLRTFGNMVSKHVFHLSVRDCESWLMTVAHLPLRLVKDIKHFCVAAACYSRSRDLNISCFDYLNITCTVSLI